jgi:hypothetical protein
VFSGLSPSEYLVADKVLALTLHDDENLANLICSDGGAAGLTLRHDFSPIIFSVERVINDLLRPNL